MRYGIDLSNYQGALTVTQAHQLADDGVQFSYVLLTDGANFKNPDAPGQCAALRAAGIHVGFYHFLRPDANIDDQILDFLTMAHGCGGTNLPLALDSETPEAYGGWSALAQKMVAFARQIELVNTDVTNPRSLLYVNETFYYNLAGFPWGRWVWYARPGVAAPDKPCLIWQEAPRPVAPLASVDYDLFMGTDADWATFTGGPPPTPQPTPDPEPAGDYVFSEIQFTTDGNGNGWVASPVGVNSIVNVVAVVTDPETSHGYFIAPRFDGITADGKLVFVGGTPNTLVGFRVVSTP